MQWLLPGRRGRETVLPKPWGAMLCLGARSVTVGYWGSRLTAVTAVTPLLLKDPSLLISVVDDNNCYTSKYTLIVLAELFTRKLLLIMIIPTRGKTDIPDYEMHHSTALCLVRCIALVIMQDIAAVLTPTTTTAYRHKI